MDHVTDENGNIATISYWGSKEAAEAFLKTLTNCRNCRNCTNCRNCIDCIDCTNCIDCRNCTTQPILNTPTNYWVICLRSDYTLKIGCQDHPVSDWLSFTDEQISKMSPKAPAFWKQWKPIIEVCYSQKDQPCVTTSTSDQPQQANLVPKLDETTTINTP